MSYKRKTLTPEYFFGAKPHVFEKAAELRKNMTPAEKVLWSVLRNRQIKGYHFRRQHPINRFIADFYCHKARLVIEVDGGIHTEPDQKEYDIGRTDVLHEFEIHVIRFMNEQVLNDLDYVIREIEDSLP